MLLNTICKGLIVSFAKSDVVLPLAPNIGSLLAAMKRWNLNGINTQIDNTRANAVRIEYFADNICSAPTSCDPCAGTTPTTVTAPVTQLIDNFTPICSHTLQITRDQYNALCSSQSDGNRAAVNDVMQAQLTDLFGRAILGAHRRINEVVYAKLAANKGTHPNGDATKILQPFNPANNYTPIPNWNRPIEKTYLDGQVPMGELVYLSGTDLQPMFNNAQSGGLNAAGVNVGQGNLGYAASMQNLYYYEPLITSGNLLTVDLRKILFLTYSTYRRNFGIVKTVPTIQQLLGNISETADPLNTPIVGQQHYRFMLPDPYLMAGNVPFYWDAHIVVDTACATGWNVKIWVDTNIAVEVLPFANCGNVSGILEWEICQPEPITCNTEPEPNTPVTPLCIIPDAAFTCKEQVVPAGTFINFAPTVGTPTTVQTTVPTTLTSMRDLWLLLASLPGLNIQYNAATNQVLYYGNALVGSTVSITFGGTCAISFTADLAACVTTPVFFSVPDTFEAEVKKADANAETDELPKAKGKK